MPRESKESQEDKTRKWTVVATLELNGKRYEAGDTLEASDKAVEFLLAVGAVERK